MRAYLNGKGDLVEQRGIEPLTSALRTRRSAKLSYCPTRKTILTFQVSGFKLQRSRDLSGYTRVVFEQRDIGTQRCARAPLRHARQQERSQVAARDVIANGLRQCIVEHFI